MTRELLLLRHGKSDWDVNVDDFNRPLKDRGKRGAQRMGVWLLQQQLIPDYVLTSPAQRALVSAEKTCKVMSIGSKHVHKKRRLYAADLYDLLQVLGKCPSQSKRVMLVGHNPGLEELLTYLVDAEIPPQKDGKLLATATLARLKVQSSWAELTPGCATLLSIKRASDLPTGFPFPSHNSTELRDRPAYYYKQSSVIPYRLVDGKLQILVILSSQKKHWVVPKGIKDPGLTAQASAAKEAWEEAGVEGDVGEQALGTYSYEKWGATCTVEVFPMQVTRLIPEKEWAENHRGRQWLTPNKAAGQLKQKALIPMLSSLVKHISGSKAE